MVTPRADAERKEEKVHPAKSSSSKDREEEEKEDSKKHLPLLAMLAMLSSNRTSVTGGRKRRVQQEKLEALMASRSGLPAALAMGRPSSKVHERKLDEMDNQRKERLSASLASHLSNSSSSSSAASATLLITKLVHPSAGRRLSLLVSLLLVVLCLSCWCFESAAASPTHCFSLCTRSENDMSCRRCRFREPMRFGKRVAGSFPPSSSSSSSELLSSEGSEDGKGFISRLVASSTTPFLSSSILPQVTAADSWLGKGVSSHNLRRREFHPLSGQEARRMRLMLHKVSQIFALGEGSSGPSSSSSRSRIDGIRGLRWG